MAHLLLQWRISTNTTTNTSSLLSDGGESCKAKCSRLFLAGVDVHYGLGSALLASSSSSSNYSIKQRTGMEEVSESSSSCQCDTLLCDSIDIGDGGGATCNWSYFAIDALLQNNYNNDDGNNDSQQQPRSNMPIQMKFSNNYIDNKQPSSSSSSSSSCSTQAQLDAFFTPPGWEHYQFSDGFKNLHQKQTEQWRYLYIRRAPKSALLRDYFESTRGNWESYAALNKLVNKRARSSNSKKSTSDSSGLGLGLLPPQNALVIHLRLGDVIDKARQSTRDLLYEQQYYYSEEDVNLPCPGPHANDIGNFTPLKVDWNAYVKPLSYFSQRLDIISQYSSVILMGSAHKGGGIHKGKQKCPEEDMTSQKSCEYIHALKVFLERSLPRDISIDLRLGQTPDDDIVFGSQASCFISSGGGFSDIIKRLQVMNTGECEKSLKW